MNATEHLKVIASEEAGEVAHAAILLQKALCKMMRFGDNDINPERGLTATQVVVAEFNDLIASIEMLEEAGIKLPGLYDREAVDKKKRKVKYMMNASREQGTLE